MYTYVNCINFNYIVFYSECLGLVYKLPLNRYFISNNNHSDKKIIRLTMIIIY